MTCYSHQRLDQSSHNRTHYVGYFCFKHQNIVYLSSDRYSHSDADLTSADCRHISNVPLFQCPCSDVVLLQLKLV